MIQELKKFEAGRLIEILHSDSKWQRKNLRSLLIDYYPPVVERVWLQDPLTGLRFYLHRIHQSSEKDCLFHKHRWPSAIHVVKGCYEMAVAYHENPVSSDAAYSLPIAASFELAEGSYYSMTTPHGMHYVNPLTSTTLSTMVSGKPYPEDIKEAEHPALLPLSDEKFFSLIAEFKSAFL